MFLQARECFAGAKARYTALFGAHHFRVALCTFMEAVAEYQGVSSKEAAKTFGKAKEMFGQLVRNITNK
jgi:hypothetical protein